MDEQRSVLTQLAAANKKQVATSHESIAKLEGLVEDLQKKVGQTIDTGDKVEDLQKKMGQIIDTGNKLTKELDSIKKNEELIQNQLSNDEKQRSIIKALQRLEDKVSDSDTWKSDKSDKSKVNQRCIQNPVKHLKWSFL